MRTVRVHVLSRFHRGQRVCHRPIATAARYVSMHGATRNTTRSNAYYDGRARDSWRGNERGARSVPAL